jgi:hypothetical protein
MIEVAKTTRVQGQNVGDKKCVGIENFPTLQLPTHFAEEGSAKYKKASIPADSPPTKNI